ncbi:MAG: phage holin family protein [Chloroflexota bacterium]|nr:phage holin family protein [Chloroflexota bacterium]
MKRLFFRLAINAIALWVAAYLISGLSLEGGVARLLLAAAVFGLVNALIRPIVKLLTLPINFITLGLFTFVVNALMLMLTAWLIPDGVTIAGNFFESFLIAVAASIVISIVSTILSWILPD